MSKLVGAAALSIFLAAVPAMASIPRSSATLELAQPAARDVVLLKELAGEIVSAPVLEEQAEVFVERPASPSAAAAEPRSLEKPHQGSEHLRWALQRELAARNAQNAVGMRPCEAENCGGLTFSGKYYDREANLFYFHARYYDPESGRFISKDGFDYGDTSNPPSLHLYYYALSNPLRYTDQDGHLPWESAETERYRQQMFNTLADMAVEGVQAIPGVAKAAKEEVAAVSRDIGTAAESGELDPESTTLGMLANPPTAHQVTDAMLHAATEAPAQMIRGFESGDADRAVRGFVGTTAEVVTTVVTAAKAPQIAASAARAGGAAARQLGEKGAEIIKEGKKALSAAVRAVEPPKPRVRRFGPGAASIDDPNFGGRPSWVDEMMDDRPSRAPRGGGNDEIARRVGKWESREVGGRTVYRRDDIFDIDTKSSWQDPATKSWKRGTNKERMADGLAPIGHDKKPINLHHLTQSEPGALAEVPSSLHSKRKHGLRAPGHSFRNDPVKKDAFETYRSEYWKLRSQEFED